MVAIRQYGSPACDEGAVWDLSRAVLEIISKNLTEVVDALRLFIIYHQVTTMACPLGVSC